MTQARNVLKSYHGNVLSPCLENYDLGILLNSWADELEVRSSQDFVGDAGFQAGVELKAPIRGRASWASPICQMFQKLFEVHHGILKRLAKPLALWSLGRLEEMAPSFAKALKMHSQIPLQGDFVLSEYSCGCFFCPCALSICLLLCC